jgi:pyridoxine/pyridoxamine 5'-phosphate oxidase
MFETADELAELQRLLDAAAAHSNPHMRSIVTPERRLSAAQVVTYLQGTRHVALATVTANGEPRVSLLDALFLHGRFTMGTGAQAVRVRNLRTNRACSAVHMDGDRVAVVVNGRVEWITRDHRDHDWIVATWLATYGSDPYDLGDIVLFRIEPVSMWTFALHSDEFPEH